MTKQSDQQEIMTQLSNVVDDQNDHSYESLEMTRAEFLKRQKRDDFFDTKPNDTKNSYALMRNITIGGDNDVRSAGMLENPEAINGLFETEPHEEFNVDDLLITRGE